MRTLLAILLGCGYGWGADTPTPPEAQTFMHRAQAKLLDLSVEQSRADWVKSTFINYDTEILAAKADGLQIAATMRWAVFKRSLLTSVR